MAMKDLKVEVLAYGEELRQYTIAVDGVRYPIHEDLLPLILGVKKNDPRKAVGISAPRSIVVPDWRETEHPLDEVVRDLIIDSAIAAKKPSDKPEYGEAW